jgi:transposase
LSKLDRLQNSENINLVFKKKTRLCIMLGLVVVV